MNDLELETRETDEAVTVLSIQGYLDKRTTGKLDKAIAALVERSRLRIVVDCTNLEYVSSDGMGIFLSYLIKIRKAGGDIKFCTMPPQARTVLSLLGLQNLVELFETEEEALTEFRKAEQGRELKKADQADSKLRITVDPTDTGVHVVILNGFIDRHTLATLDKTLKQLLDDGNVQIVVDFAELSYISSNGVGIFIRYVNWARGRGGDIRFCAMRDIAHTVITMLGLHNLFKIYESRDQAIVSYDG